MKTKTAFVVTILEDGSVGIAGTINDRPTHEVLGCEEPDNGVVEYAITVLNREIESVALAKAMIKHQAAMMKQMMAQQNSGLVIPSPGTRIQ